MSNLGINDVGTFQYDNLFAGTFPVVSHKVTVASGENLVRGSLLGRITTGGKYKLSASASLDGSEEPRAVLAEDIDATGGDKEALVYLSGEFYANAMHFGEGLAADIATQNKLHDGSSAIYIKL